MSGTDLPLSPRERLIGADLIRRRPAPSARRIATRHWMVLLTKWSLPVFALLLLAAVALWPEIARVQQQGRIALRRAFQVDPESGRMLAPRYRGVDERGRPYTVTATQATQASPERITMTDPKGDVVTESGTWLMAQSRDGVFIQHASLLDMSHDVSLYREDGTVLQTDSAALDLKAGAAASSELTHAEGPFGTLDCQGFTLTDKGAVIQFQGPSHLVLNSTDQKK